MLQLTEFVPFIISLFISTTSGSFFTGVSVWSIFQLLYVFWLKTWAFNEETETTAYGWYMLFSIIGALIGYIFNKYTLQKINIFNEVDTTFVVLIIVICTLELLSILLFTYFQYVYSVVVFGGVFLVIWITFGCIIYFVLRNWEKACELDDQKILERKYKEIDTSQKALGYFPWTTTMFFVVIIGQFTIGLFQYVVSDGQTMYATAISSLLGIGLIVVSYFILHKDNR